MKFLAIRQSGVNTKISDKQAGLMWHMLSPPATLEDATRAYNKHILNYRLEEPFICKHEAAYIILYLMGLHLVEIIR